MAEFSGIPHSCESEASEAHHPMSDLPDQPRRRADLLRSIAELPIGAHFVAAGERILLVNSGFEALTGYSAAELSSLGLRHLFPLENPLCGPDALSLPSEGQGDPDATDSSRGSKQPVLHFETRMTTRTGAGKWVVVAAAPIQHNQGSARAGTVMDITAYREREEALRRSEMRYRKIFELAPDGFILYSMEGRVIDFNPEARSMHGGYSPQEVDNISVTEKLSEEDKARFAEIQERTIQDGEWAGELKGYRKDGELMIVDSRVKVADIGGEKIVISIARDITERKRMEEQIRNALKEKEVLLREIHHRVKNNMQIISSLLKLQLGNAGDERTRALFRESQNRILSMAMIHEKLYQSAELHKINLNDYVADLAGEVLFSFSMDPDRITLRREMQDIALGMDTTIPCGLIIIELLSNALKHAFPEGRKGEVFIGLRSQEDGCLELTVSDNGVGLPPETDISRLKSLGLRLVSDLAVYQLEGEMEIAGHPGTTVRVRFHEREKERE